MSSSLSRMCLMLTFTALPISGTVQARSQTQTPIDKTPPAASTRLAVVQDQQGFLIKPAPPANAGYPCSVPNPTVRLGTGLKLDAAIFDRATRPLEEVADAPRR